MVDTNKQKSSPGVKAKPTLPGESISQRPTNTIAATTVGARPGGVVQSQGSGAGATNPVFVGVDDGGTSKHGGTNVIPQAPPKPAGPALSQGMRDDAISAYKRSQFGYNPYQTTAGPKLQGMDFNPYRQGQMNQAASQAGAGYQGLISQLEQSGGASGADRINAVRQFNRQKVTGQLGAASGVDQLQSKNIMDVGQYNLGRGLDVQRQNITAQNEAARDLARAQQVRDENLYSGALDERNLQRQLEASQLIGQAQAKGGGGGFLDQLFGTLSGVFGR